MGATTSNNAAGASDPCDLRDIALHPAASLSEFLRYCDSVGVCFRIANNAFGWEVVAPCVVSKDEDLLYYLHRHKDAIIAFLYEPASQC